MSEELENTAAEYVLGTLPADERARFAERMKGDPALRAEVSRLQAHLSSLDESIPAERPRAEVWSEIERQTAGSTAPGASSSNVIELRRTVARWRNAALLTGALAAGLAAVVVIDRLSMPPVPEGGRYVAVVDTGGHEPALIAELDTGTGIIRVRTLAAEAPSGRSLELWHVAEGHEPRSLGILQAGLDAQTIQDIATTAPVDGMIAVSVEPEGGSPSGAPTGPIVYTGRLIPVEE